MKVTSGMNFVEKNAARNLRNQGQSIGQISNQLQVSEDLLVRFFTPAPEPEPVKKKRAPRKKKETPVAAPEPDYANDDSVHSDVGQPQPDRENGQL